MKLFFWLLLAAPLLVAGCSSTEIIESPKTTYVPLTGETKPPAVIWTSRTMTQSFDYLGLIKVRGWSYDGALGKLVDAGEDMHADAIIDVYYQKIGFLSAMQAFAVKFK